MTKLRVHSFSISVDGFGAGPHQDLANPLGGGCTEVTAERQASMTTLRHAGPPMSELGFWVGTCLGRSVDLGPTTLGKGGGAKTRLSTLPSSCLATIPGHRSPWTVARSSISLPMVLKPR